MFDNNLYKKKEREKILENTKEINAEKKIMEIATELFALNGLEGTSIRDICKKANVNVSMISYYFGGKNELYQRIVENITQNIIDHFMKSMNITTPPENFDHLNRDEKIALLFKFMDMMIDYFYSDKISKSSIMILFREQITSGVALNAFGYRIFKKLLASILEKDENDKEVIFRCLTIVGQMNSARILTQFSLKMMNQDTFTKEDVQMIKNIAISQTKSILEGIGVQK